MKRALLTIIGFLISLVSFSQVGDDRLENIEDDIKELLSIYGATGVSISIVENDSIIYSQGFGYRDKEKLLKMNSETIIPIASITKSFTATLLGFLNEEEVISLQAKPRDYIPDLEFYNNKMEDLITIEDLLCHKSGIGGQDGSSIFFLTKSNSEFIPRFKYLKPTGAIKNSFQYSNVGYGLAGYLVEKVTNKSWNKNLEERIFEPLKMKNTVSSIDAMVKSGNYSKGYGSFENNQVEVPFHHFSFTSPDGAICSSARDMGNWMIPWLNSGVYKDNQVIPEVYVSSASTIHNILPQNGANKEVYLMGYGYGWYVQSYKGHYNVRHSGGTSGFSTHLTMYPYEKIGIVVLSNQHSSALSIFIEQMISDRMLGLPRKNINNYPIYVQSIIPIPTVWNDEIDNKTVQDFNALCGKYKNKGYGTIVIEAINNILYASFPGYKFRLEPTENRSYIMQPITNNSQYFNPNFTITFSDTEAENVKELQINFQAEPVIFKVE